MGFRLAAHSTKYRAQTQRIFKKTEVESARNILAADDHFEYGDEVNLSVFPTLRKLWACRGQQVQILTHGQAERAYGIGVVNYHTGETVMITRTHKRKEDIGVFLRTLLAHHETGTMYLAWDNATTHFGGDIEVVLKEAHGRLVLLYLPTYSPWLNPIEKLWWDMRYNVTHCELFETICDLELAFHNYFATTPKETVRSIIGSKAA